MILHKELICKKALNILVIVEGQRKKNAAASKHDFWIKTRFLFIGRYTRLLGPSGSRVPLVTTKHTTNSIPQTRFSISLNPQTFNDDSMDIKWKQSIAQAKQNSDLFPWNPDKIAIKFVIPAILRNVAMYWGGWVLTWHLQVPESNGSTRKIFTDQSCKCGR